MYCQDYDGKFPHADNVDVGYLGWAEKIQPYTKNLQVFQCPSEAQPQVLPEKYTDYFANTWFSTRPEGVNQDQIELPANTIAAGESRAAKSDVHCQAMRGIELSCDTGSDPIQFIDIETAARRHSLGANYLFVDGHVKWLRPESTMEGNYTNVVTPDVFGFKFRGAF